MTFLELVAFAPDRHLTCVARPPVLESVFATFAVSYVIVPRGPRRSRLIVKLLVRYPRGPVGWLMRSAFPWGDLVMMRKQLLTLKTLAETTA